MNIHWKCNLARLLMSLERTHSAHSTFLDMAPIYLGLNQNCSIIRSHGFFCVSRNRSVFESDSWSNRSSVQQTVHNLFGSFLLILVDRLGPNGDQVVLYAAGSDLAEILDTHRIGSGFFLSFVFGVHPSIDRTSNSNAPSIPAGFILIDQHRSSLSLAS